MNKEEEGRFCSSKDRAMKVSQLGRKDDFSELSRSEYSMKEVLDLAEFRQLSKEIQLQDHQENRLVDSFYYPQWRPNSSKFERGPAPSRYLQEYSKWKGEEAKEDTFRSTYASTLALVSKEQQRQEVDRLLKEYSVDQAIFSYSNQNPLFPINKEYSQSLASLANHRQLHLPPQAQDRSQNRENLIPDPSVQPKPVHKWTQNQNFERNQQKQAIIELEVQQQLLHRLKQINQEQKTQELKAKKQKQLRKYCFKDLIQRPPSSLFKQQQPQTLQNRLQSDQQINDKVNTRSNYRQQQQVPSINQRAKKEAHYRLNVDQILKIPYRLFLIFYSENYHQIVRLSSPSDLKRINSYRGEALKRQQAVELLKRKVAEEGSQLVSQLPSQLKDKLFRVLYEQELQEEKYAQEYK